MCPKKRPFTTGRIPRSDVIFGGGGTDRYQHAGIINNYRVGAIVMGHSHAANYLPSKIEKELKTSSTYSLTMDGSTICEQACIGQYALKKKKIQYVLWGLSQYNFMEPPDQRNSKLPLKAYLYDGNRFNDLNFFLTFDLFNYNIKKQTRKKIIRDAPNPEILQKQEFDRATAWQWKQQNGFNRPLFVAQKILKNHHLSYNPTQLRRLEPIKNHMLLTPRKSDVEFITLKMKHCTETITQHILPLIMNHPEVKFDFVLTAFPTLRVQTRKLFQKRLYSASLIILEKVVDMISKHPNARVFAFGLEKFTDDLRLYKDQGHYHIAVNDFIVEAIARNRNMLTKDNVYDYLLQFDRKVSEYRLPKNWNPEYHNLISSKGSPLSMKNARRLIKDS